MQSEKLSVYLQVELTVILVSVNRIQHINRNMLINLQPGNVAKILGLIQVVFMNKRLGASIGIL